MLIKLQFPLIIVVLYQSEVARNQRKIKIQDKIEL